jgi:serine/threonine protein kinase
MLLHFELLAPLGEGAMGEVWRARDARLGREVAVEVLPPRFVEEEERLLRFKREARSVASLNHSCVAQIHGVDRVEDLRFLVLGVRVGGCGAAQISTRSIASPVRTYAAPCHHHARRDEVGLRAAIQ